MCGGSAISACSLAATSLALPFSVLKPEEGLCSLLAPADRPTPPCCAVAEGARCSQKNQRSTWWSSGVTHSTQPSPPWHAFPKVTRNGGNSHKREHWLVSVHHAIRYPTFLVTAALGSVRRQPLLHDQHSAVLGRCKSHCGRVQCYGQLGSVCTALPGRHSPGR